MGASGNDCIQKELTAGSQLFFCAIAPEGRRAGDGGRPPHLRLQWRHCRGPNAGQRRHFIRT